MGHVGYGSEDTDLIATDGKVALVRVDVLRGFAELVGSGRWVALYPTRRHSVRHSDIAATICTHSRPACR